MPRTARQDQPGGCLYVLNRGNRRATVFNKPGDYAAFLRCFAAARARHPVNVFCFCLMPNHFHCVLEADGPRTLGAFMQRWMTTHVRRYHAHYHSSGHVWQGRFKSFSVADEAHFLTVVRYVLQNPVRASLVSRAADWPWSSLAVPSAIDPSPVDLPRDLHAWLAEPLPHAELEQLRALINQPALLLP